MCRIDRLNTNPSNTESFRTFKRAQQHIDYLTTAILQATVTEKQRVEISFSNKYRTNKHDDDDDDAVAYVVPRRWRRRWPLPGGVAPSSSRLAATVGVIFIY